MECLPEELLHGILEQLWYDDITSFLKSIRCSKRMFRIAHPILYTHVSVPYTDRLDVPRWIATFHTSQQNRNALKCLSLTSIVYLQNLTKGEWELFLKALSEFANLKTFSFSNFEYELAQYEMGTAKEMLCPILLALPCSMVNLELSLDCAVRDNVGPHLCETINTLLPRLENLKLRLPRICTGFMDCVRPTHDSLGDRNVSKLQHVSVWLQHQRTAITTPLLCSSQRILSVESFEEASRVPNQIAIAAQHAYNDGRLPHLQDFNVVHESGIWTVREIVSNTTLELSHVYLAGEHGKIVIFRDTGDTAYSTSLVQLDNVLEPAGWTHLPNLAHIPRAKSLSFKERCNRFAQVVNWLSPGLFNTWPLNRDENAEFKDGVWDVKRLWKAAVLEGT